MLGQPQAALGWGIGGILAGSLIFLFSPLERWYRFFALLGVWVISGAPFTPLARAEFTRAARALPILVVFVIAHAGLVIGYVRQALRTRVTAAAVERWVHVIFPFGLVLLVLVSTVITIWPWSGEPATASVWWPGIAAIFLAAGASLWVMPRSDLEQARHGIGSLDRAVGWILLGARNAYRSMHRLILFLTAVLEGEGGLIWALLLLTLLISLLAQNVSQVLSNGF